MVSPPFARFNPNREFSKYQKFLQKSGCFRDKLTLKGMGKSKQKIIEMLERTDLEVIKL